MSEYKNENLSDENCECVVEPCEEECPDVCKKICLSGQIQRGEFEITNPQSNQLEVKPALVIVLQVKNCTGAVINHFRPLLQISYLDPNETEDKETGVKHLVTGFVQSIIPSIGCPNFPNESEDFVNFPWNGNTVTALLVKGVQLPPGTFTIKLYLLLDKDFEHYQLLPPIFSVEGQLKCCQGQCSKLHKSIRLSSDCLPLELNH